MIQLFFFATSAWVAFQNTQLRAHGRTHATSLVHACATCHDSRATWRPLHRVAPPQEGLCVYGSFDQTVRVGLVTKLSTL